MSNSIKSIGLIHEDRLRLIPKNRHAEHEFCFHLHDIMVGIARDAEELDTHSVKINFKSASEADKFFATAGDDPLDALIKLGYIDEARRAAVNHVTRAVFSDFLHFIFEGLKALEKRKFTVALSLFRKPFKENLFALAWACADELAFFKAFSEEPDRLFASRHVQQESRKQIFDQCSKNLHIDYLFSGHIIYEILYNKASENGLSNLFDKATHLVTSGKPLLKTEAMNFNFVFKNPEDNDIYESIYKQISYLLMFALFVQIELYSKMHKIQNLFRSHTELVALGCYGAIFTPGRSHVADFLNVSLKDFLLCPYCSGRIKIGKPGVPRFLIMENVSCSKCGAESHFPFFWMWSKINWSNSHLMNSPLSAPDVI